MKILSTRVIIYCRFIFETVKFTNHLSSVFFIKIIKIIFKLRDL